MLVILLLTVHYYRVALLDLMQTIQAQRDEIEQMAMHDAFSMRHGELSLRVGVSIGVAGFPDDGENADKLKIEADQAMYRNKQ